MKKRLMKGITKIGDITDDQRMFLSTVKLTRNSILCVTF